MSKIKCCYKLGTNVFGKVRRFSPPERQKAFKSQYLKRSLQLNLFKMADLTNLTLFSLPILSVIHILSLSYFSVTCLMIPSLFQEVTMEPFVLRSNMPMSVYTKLSPEQMKDANFSFSCQVKTTESSNWYTIYLLRFTAIVFFSCLGGLMGFGSVFKRKVKLQFSPELIRKLNREKDKANEKIIEFIFLYMEYLIGFEVFCLLLVCFIFYWFPTPSPAIDFNLHNEQHFRYLTEFCQLANANRTEAVDGETIYIYEKHYDGIRSYFFHMIVEPYLRSVMLITGIISFINLTKYIDCYYDIMSMKVWNHILVIAEPTNERQNDKSKALDCSPSDGDIYFEAES